MTDRLPVADLGTAAREMDLGTAKTYQLPDWHKMSHPERLQTLRQISEWSGRWDPKIAKLAVSIISPYRRTPGSGRGVVGARPRQYEKQAAALLRWVQDPKNIYYVNESGEKLQDPSYTVRVKHGDCDDQVLLLCALFESIGLPWKLCLTGRDSQGQKIRHIEGNPIPGGCNWLHIYCMVGTPPFRPTRWFFCEPTIEKVPLGWDVVDGNKAYLPELEDRSGPVQVLAPGAPPRGFRPSDIPAAQHRSGAYEVAYGSALGPAVGGAVADQVGREKAWDWGKLGLAILTGVAVSVATQLTLDWVRGDGTWKGTGSLRRRVGKSQRDIDKSNLAFVWGGR